MLVSGYNNIILLPNCTMLYYVFSGHLSLRAYVPETRALLRLERTINLLCH